MMIQVPVMHKINHLFNLFHPQSSSILLNLCKSCVLFLALLASFHTILILKLRRKTPSISPLIPEYDDYTDDEDDETCSLSSTSSESEDKDEEEREQENRTGECFRFRGDDDGEGGFLRSCRSIGDMFSLSEITNSKSVVQLWDTIGLGLGFGIDDSDWNYDERIVTAYGNDENLSVSSQVWDTRVRRRIPAVVAEWAPGVGKTVGVVSGGEQKVYVRDDGRYELTVGEMRNVMLPLEYVTESQLDLWWRNSCMLKI